MSTDLSYRLELTLPHPTAADVAARIGAARDARAELEKYLDEHLLPRSQSAHELDRFDELKKRSVETAMELAAWLVGCEVHAIVQEMA